ncbi:MAG: hypothetical protein D6740_08905 [Alphaproteobacteria bacterium]|nr:MAG: hypothetical protein D6740_08905 [Alphaproteobacteria bacterium]
MASLAPHELVPLIGEDATVRLLVRLGGVEVYIPDHPGEDSEIANIIGLAAARRLARVFGKRWVNLPKARGWCRRTTLRRVAEGQLSARQAALLLDLTERHVRRLLAGNDPNGATRKLAAVQEAACLSPSSLSLAGDGR